VAAQLIDRAVALDRMVTSPQVLNESYAVLTKRAGALPASSARIFVRALAETCMAPLTPETLFLAWDIQDEVRFSLWDSLLIASALQAGCDYFLTEDLSDRQHVRGMTLLNPFTNDMTPLLS
jgi:predicted nucleic acid-binding protein